MIDEMLSTIAPHHCCGCDKIGCLLCDNCKNNITSESKPICVACRRPTANMWLCSDCRVPYTRAWAVGERSGVLQRLVGDFKFQRMRSAHKILGELLAGALPDLPPDTVIVPVPTTSGHIRERGYDHTLLIARHVAKSKGLQCNQLLQRVTNTKQRQASVKQRETQARQAFTTKGPIDGNVPYLLIDDVVTTGATVKYASRALIRAGAKNVWVAVVARQLLQ